MINHTAAWLYKETLLCLKKKSTSLIPSAHHHQRTLRKKRSTVLHTTFLHVLNPVIWLFKPWGELKGHTAAMSEQSEMEETGYVWNGILTYWILCSAAYSDSYI